MQSFRNNYPFELAKFNAKNNLAYEPVPNFASVATFGMGCFWGVERLFSQINGVINTMVGYTGGVTPYPTYEEVCTGSTHHAEVVRLFYDERIVDYRSLLKLFWENHIPTQGMRQGNDIGSQYRSMIVCYSSNQTELALETMDAYKLALSASNLPSDITTEIINGNQHSFYFAESYHQQYLYKNPNGYCGLRGSGACLI